ncbi:MAG: hypothetical protein JWO53_1233, partial [Chlamydiia bacterium]|nr:hypothetical protein [Chlamydiia bacterium]
MSTINNNNRLYWEPDAKEKEQKSKDWKLNKMGSQGKDIQATVANLFCFDTLENKMTELTLDQVVEDDVAIPLDPLSTGEVGLLAGKWGTAVVGKLLEQVDGDTSQLSLINRNEIRKVGMRVRVLHIEKCSLSAAKIALLAQNFPLLQKLFCRSLDTGGIEKLSAFSHLKLLHVKNCKQIRDEELRALSTSKLTLTLQFLILSRCKRISDSGICHLRSLKRLKMLHVLGCRGLTNYGVQQLKSLQELYDVRLGTCSI